MTAGRPRKPLWQHNLEGTRPSYTPTKPSHYEFDYTDMSERKPEKPKVFRPGLDIEFLPKLVDAHSLARLFDCDPGTVRRWTRNGTMPKPLHVGGRRLWQADVIRRCATTVALKSVTTTPHPKTRGRICAPTETIAGLKVGRPEASPILNSGEPQ